MSIQIHMIGPAAEQELGSLYTWLQDESDIRRHAGLSLLASEPGPSDMGGALEVIQLVIDSGFQMLNLALAYASWRATRSNRPQVTIEKDGVKITLDDADSDIVQTILQTMQ